MGPHCGNHLNSNNQFSQLPSILPIIPPEHKNLDMQIQTNKSIILQKEIRKRKFFFIYVLHFTCFLRFLSPPRILFKALSYDLFSRYEAKLEVKSYFDSLSLISG